MVRSVLLSFCFLGFAACARGEFYKLEDDIVGPRFLSAFDFQDIADPTHGRVRYVNKFDALWKNLTYVDENSFILRTDYTNTLDPNGPGRDSVRVMSKKTYSTVTTVFDVRHMPQGCGTWPAIWTTTTGKWPDGGEVDIMEGVNDQWSNQATLHTGPGCTMPPYRLQTGMSNGDNCDVYATYNAGCSVGFQNPLSYGPQFNRNGGGWYAMERTPFYVKVWFWTREDIFVPHDVKHGGSHINTGSWGIPAAYFPNTSCNFDKFFSDHNIIINLTLCGDWAGNDDVYSNSGCPSTCVDHVNNNPSAFADAYFDIASLRIYC
ncbi:glycoside hydrolase family 16 protein [Crucibulum laeve]|uniref:Glycoside hydrolase family 16 protein n=1 Tax=Crucibulum laeve TaxID=68775 RepID=A0A5C3LPX1_9AGAR|nr:glycoside hydrolase family 16 protein [Crucibulum laeve]